MRLHQSLKLSRELIDDQMKLNATLYAWSIRCRQEVLLKESKKVCSRMKIKVGLDGDDFVRNLISAVIRFQAVKVPRIIKNRTVTEWLNLNADRMADDRRPFSSYCDTNYYKITVKIKKNGSAKPALLQPRGFCRLKRLRKLRRADASV